jgi:MFS family permease
MEVLRNSWIAASGAALIGAPIAGFLAARFGGKRVLLAALFALAASTVWAFVWVPPALMIALFALSGFAQAAVWCSIIAVLADAAEIERPWVVATSLSAAVSIGSALITAVMAVVMTTNPSIALVVPLVLLGVALVVRRTLRNPARETETRIGSNYRDVEVIERSPSPLQRARGLATTPSFFVAAAVMAATAVAQALISIARGVDLSLATRSIVISLATFVSAIVAILVVRSARYLLLGVAAPLALAALLSMTFLAPATTSVFGFILATAVASTVAGGSLPFVVGRDREGAPIVAGFLTAASHLGTNFTFYMSPSTSGAFVTALASTLVGLALAAWLMRYAQR